MDLVDGSGFWQGTGKSGQGPPPPVVFILYRPFIRLRRRMILLPFLYGLVRWLGG